jgi:hypothetical protein
MFEPLGRQQSLTNDITYHCKLVTYELEIINNKTWEREVSIEWTLSMRKRDGRPFTGVFTIFDREPHSDPPCK